MSNAIAVSIVPGEVRLLVARGNGDMKPLHQLAGGLPRGAVQPGLRTPNIADPDAVAASLRGLAAEASLGRERGGMVAILVPDASVRMGLLPIEGTDPSAAEGEAMARWALADILPIDAGAARVDWSVLAEEAPASAAARSWLVAVGADAAVIGEYESVVQRLGWTPGRVVPLTLALATGAGDIAGDDAAGMARIVISGLGQQPACLVEAAGVPRFHRSWRGSEIDLERELASIARYAAQRMDLTIVDAVLAGSKSWLARTTAACKAMGWTAHSLSLWSAHLGAVQP